MNVLLIHQNFPGQFRRLAPYLVEECGFRVVALGDTTSARQHFQHPRFTFVTYPKPQGATAGIHPYLQSTEAAVRRGQAVVRACIALKSKGFDPDVVFYHAAWGEGLFLRDVFPRARLIGYFEFFYRSTGSDVGFDAEFGGPDLDAMARLRLRNTTQLISLTSCDVGVAPTQWQAAQFPPEWQSRLRTLHEGIDTDVCAPDGGASFEVEGKVFRPGDPVVTFVNRNLEPYRGFHVFMRALPELQRRCPGAHIVVVGGDAAGYGRLPRQGGSWREVLLNELEGQLDLRRIYFVGKLPYERYVALLQVSAAHVYLTYPFVLSWSLLEAMSIGCAVIGSRTAPVEEVVRHEETGLLFDFFDAKGMAEQVAGVLAEPERYAGMRQRARAFVRAGFDARTRCMPALHRLIAGD